MRKMNVIGRDPFADKNVTFECKAVGFLPTWLRPANQRSSVLTGIVAWLRELYGRGELAASLNPLSFCHGIHIYRHLSVSIYMISYLYFPVIYKYLDEWLIINLCGYVFNIYAFSS